MANELPKYVFHEEFGEGETINGMQTIDESGDVTNTDVMFEHGIVRDVPVEELMVLEGRGRPKGSKNKPKGGETKPTMPATKTPSNSEDDDSDGPSGPGIHGELLRHQDLGDLKHHEIEFHDGKKVKVSPEHRNKALAHIKSMMGPGKNPDTRMAALRKLGSNHETFKQMIGEQVEQVDEISKEAKKRYLGKAVGDLTGRAYDHGVHTAGPYNRTDKDIDNDKRKIKNRQVGIYRATQEEVEQVDEISLYSDNEETGRDNEKRRMKGPSIPPLRGKPLTRPKPPNPPGFPVRKPSSTASYKKEEVEQVDEKLIGKQKNLDKNRNGKLDRQDFKMLRKESVEPKVSVYTEANRFRSVENAVKDIMLNNTNLRQLAKEEEFKRNNPGHFED
jgi:hypothetical protein